MSKGSNRAKIFERERKMALKANTNKTKKGKNRTKEHELYAQLDSVLENQ